MILSQKLLIKITFFGFLDVKYDITMLSALIIWVPQKIKKLDFFLGGGEWLESVNTLLNQFDEAIVRKGLKKAALCSLILFDASLAK